MTFDTFVLAVVLVAAMLVVMFGGPDLVALFEGVR